MKSKNNYPFDIEWLPEGLQKYHGPRKRMREFFQKHDDKKIAFSESQVANYLIENFSDYVKSIDKIKFYTIDDKGKKLNFFILWCDYNVDAREFFFVEAKRIVSQTGWYPLVTGHRIFHHRRKLVDFVDKGLRKAMNKSNIEALNGLGRFLGVANLSQGQGTSILIKTSEYDIVFDAGLDEEEIQFDLLRDKSRKWLFVSHAHRDHIGGIAPFIYDKKFLISSTPITLEIFFHSILGHKRFLDCLPKNFFYRFAPMWYRSRYQFSDGSSIQTVPTYHFPGSMGFILTFSNGKTLFYSGDLNVSCSYLSSKTTKAKHTFKLEIPLHYIDYVLIDGAYIGRKIGSPHQEIRGIFDAVKSSLISGHNYLFLVSPSDYGVFLYLHLYDRLISSSRDFEARIFLDPSIIRQLEILEWRLKRKRKGELDDALVKFLSSRKTLAESVRIFDSSVNLEENLKMLNKRNLRAIAIMDYSQFDDEDSIYRKGLSYLAFPGLEISRIGRASSMPLQKFLIEDTKVKKVSDFDEGIWLLHTQEQLLEDYFLLNRKNFGYVFLFHNFKGRMKKFIKNIKEKGYLGSISALTDYDISKEVNR